MKKNLFTLLLFVVSFFGFSQDMVNPIQWELSLKSLDNNEYEITYTALIEEGWHLYSQILADEFDGPLPTEFIYEEGGFELVGTTSEPQVAPKFDEVFKMEILSFEDRAEFVQKIKVTDAALKWVDSRVMYMVCDDEKCLPDEREFRFYLDGSKPSREMTAAEKEEEDQLLQASATPTKTDTDQANSADKDEEELSLWRIFIPAFLFGFVALLTPCVFPMIPLTVSFFTKQSKNKAQGVRNAIIYGISIVVIYVFLGWLVSWLFGADALNALSTNVTFNLVFFLILVVFAISFFGAFEINLPSSWANKVDRQADRGGLIGIFFMALALAIVSFSCTGPIVGTLLIEAASSGKIIAPIVGMLGFSLAIALPFMFFAMVPGWMNSLPKSGGWLNSVKVVLGFLELALAFKFLSNADLVLQAHWLEREVFVAIWIAIFGTLTLYLFNKIKLPHDSAETKIGVGRLLFGLLTLTFTLYLIPGLWGAPLKIISGFTPPMTYSESPYGVGYNKTITVFDEEGLPEGAKFGPHDILTFTDYEKGMAYAKSVNKPVMIDFTGHACINCRKMEERVWAEPQILNILKNELVLISLYVDEKKRLPEEEQYISETTGKKIRSVGNKWSDFQIKHYRMNAQPYYVLINLNEEELIEPVGYTPDATEYENWLREGLKNF
jgi:thiol:disulfide interchange protein